MLAEGAVHRLYTRRLFHRRLGRRLEDVDVFLIPMYVGGNHFILGRVAPRAHSLTVMDSLSHLNSATAERALADLSRLVTRHATIAEAREAGWSVEVIDGPRQRNGYDCGVWVCAEALFQALGQGRRPQTAAEIRQFRDVVALVLHQAVLCYDGAARTGAAGEGGCRPADGIG
jgi:Ulp1 family protease